MLDLEFEADDVVFRLLENRIKVLEMKASEDENRIKVLESQASEDENKKVILEEKIRKLLSKSPLHKTSEIPDHLSSVH